jgi:hypothetical protein
MGGSVSPLKLSAKELEQLEQLVETLLRDQRRDGGGAPGSLEQPLSFAELAEQRQTNLRPSGE